ncbi:hypothetical protein B0H13DRAFT_2348759 [Mycena leptocephala]|nr:hypothetical protein B0H13DRAFT_2348759 [Mycena leptocephala]
MRARLGKSARFRRLGAATSESEIAEDSAISSEAMEWADSFPWPNKSSRGFKRHIVEVVVAEPNSNAESGMLAKHLIVLGSTSGCLRALCRGIEACVRIDPRSSLVAVGLRLLHGSSIRPKTVVICLFARRVNHRCPRALRWPKVVHAPQTPRLRANVPLPISAVVTRIVHPYGSATDGLFSPSRPVAALLTPAPPSAARCSAYASTSTSGPRRQCRPSRLSVPHPRHIHHHLPNTAANCTRTRRSALPPQVNRRREGREGYGGSLCAQPAEGWEKGSPRTARGAIWSCGARMTLDGETRSLPASISLSAVYLKTLRSRAGAARARGCGHAVAAPLSSSSAAVYLCRGMTGRRDKCCGMTTVPNVYRNTPSPALHPTSAPPISLPPHCTTFSSIAGAPRPPTFSTSRSDSPHSYLQTRSLPSTLSAAWAPAIRAG